MIDIYTQNDVELFDRLSRKPAFIPPLALPRFSLRKHGFHALITYSENDVRNHHHALYFNGKKL